jgi:hypothetical protein
MEQNYLYSSFRENTLEHIFIGDCLRRLWARGVYDAEVLRADVDAAGYDIVMEVGGVLRHIQLKASYNGARTSKQNVNAKLAEKPSGCVVWMGFDPDTIELGPFYWFGGAPTEPMLALTDLKKAKHTKGDATGAKAERQNTYVVKKSAFEKLDTIDEVIDRLFGEVASNPA